MARADDSRARDASGIPALLRSARWIWPGLPNYDLHNRYALFRRTFRLDKLPRRAPAAITADQSYRLCVNGQPVCSGPARGRQESWPFDQIDLAPWLRRGRNVIAVRVHHPGCGTFSYVSRDCAGLLFALRAGALRLVSDDAWRCRLQEGVRRDVAPLSAQLAYQEHTDLRVEDPDWLAPDFDDSSWPPAKDGREWNAMPWHALEPRGIPLLAESEILRGHIIGSASGAGDPAWETARDVFALRRREGLAHRAVPADAFPRNIPPGGPSGWSSLLVDFSRLAVGYPVLRIDGARGGETVDLTFHETLSPGSLTPDACAASLSNLAMANRLVLRPGRNAHTFYHPIGFRFATLAVRGSSAPLTVDFSVRRTAYPLVRTGTFASDDDTLNRIWEACAWTQECCSLDAYVDTPWREQAQWWGDARVQAWNTFHLADDARLLRRGIGCIAAQPTPNGLTYGHAPTKAHGCILPDFSLIWILTLWDHYWQTGSPEAFLAHRAQIGDVLGYFRGQTDPATGLVRHDPRYWLFLDWTNLHKTGCPSPLSLWLLEALDKLDLLHRAAGIPREAAPLRAWARRLRRSLLALQNSRGLLADGFDARGRMVKQYSPHSQTLALMTGLDRATEPAKVRDILLPLVRGEKTFEASPGPYWMTYVFSELARRGHGADVVSCIRQKWRPMAEHGSTWETFEPRRGDESFSHAWSAHPLFHLVQILGGIRQTAPAWREIHVEPVFAGQRVECAVPSPRGPIGVRWQKRETHIEMELDLPAGVQAAVRLPGRNAAVARGRKNRFRIPDPTT